MAQLPNPGQPKPRVERAATVIETDEDIRRALQSGLQGTPPGLPAEPRAMRAPPPSAGRAASPFRPTGRPPIAFLTVFDDGKTDGEVIRKPEGAWYAENNKTANGLWLRKSPITVETIIQFPIGEQRLRIQVQ